MELKVDNKSIEPLINAQIKAAVADVLAKNSDTFIAKLVDAALAEPAKNDYHDKRPLIDKAIAEGLREAAMAAAKGWLDEQKPKIAEMVRRRLDGDKKSIIASIMDQLVGGFQRGVSVNVWFKGKEG